MTSIVFLRARDSDACVLAGDRLLVSDGGTHWEVDTPKVWAPAADVLVGWAGNAAAGQHMQRVSLRAPKKNESSKEYVVAYLVPSLFGPGLVRDKEVSLIVVVRGQPFLVDSDGCVLPVARSYASVGSGEEYTNGVLSYAILENANTEDNIESLAAVAIEIASDHTVTVGPASDYVMWKPTRVKRKKK